MLQNTLFVKKISSMEVLIKMVIMFIFIGLTIVFVIGTAIYLNKKKNQNGFIQKNNKKTKKYLFT